MVRARVKWFNPTKNFGFLHLEDGPDAGTEVFVHGQDVVGPILGEGDNVNCEVGIDPRNGKKRGQNVTGGSGNNDRLSGKDKGGGKYDRFYDNGDRRGKGGDRDRDSYNNYNDRRGDDRRGGRDGYNRRDRPREVEQSRASSRERGRGGGNNARASSRGGDSNNKRTDHMSIKDFREQMLKEREGRDGGRKNNKGSSDSRDDSRSRSREDRRAASAKPKKPSNFS